LIEDAKNIDLYLKQHHLDKLFNEHGLTVTTIKSNNLYSADAVELNKILKRNDIKIDGVVIPYDSSFSRVRLTKPVKINDTEVKYLSPLNSTNHLYSRHLSPEILKNIDIPLYFTEGEFKALKASQEGFHCIGLAGIWGFASNSSLIDGFNNINLYEREIIIVLDSDANFNYNVLHAGYRLAIELSKLGAKTKVVVLPELENLTKTGLDDLLVHKGNDYFNQIIRNSDRDESLLELQKLSIQLIQFSKNNNIKYELQNDYYKVNYNHYVFKIEPDNKNPALNQIALYRNNQVLGTDKVNLAFGSKKDAYIKRCNIEPSKDKQQIRALLDVICEFNTLLKPIQEIEYKIKKDLRKKYPINSSISENKRHSAMELAKNPELLYKIQKEFERLGLVGEKENALLLYLALVSRLLQKPISIVIKSGSSAGKSFLIKIILNLFPKDTYIELTGLSPKSLIYLKEEFKHKFLIIFEVHGFRDDDYTEHLIRTLLSENKITYAVVEKNNNDGHETKIIEREGPTGLITTTTLSNIHDENETRLFSITLDEKSDQTKDIKLNIAKSYGLTSSNENNDVLNDLLNLQKILDTHPVFIPFAEILAELTPDEPLRIRRDFQRILAVIEASALLHQYQRETKEYNGIKHIVAGLEDYFIAKLILENPLGLTIQNNYPQTLEIVKEIKNIHKKTTKPVLIKDLMKKLNKKRMSITRWLKPALENGWIENIGEEGKGKPFKLIPNNSDEHEITADFLPLIESLLDSFPDMAHNFKVINPITGESLSAEQV